MNTHLRPDLTSMTQWMASEFIKREVQITNGMALKIYLKRTCVRNKRQALYQGDSSGNPEVDVGRGLGGCNHEYRRGFGGVWPGSFKGAGESDWFYVVMFDNTFKRAGYFLALPCKTQDKEYMNILVPDTSGFGPISYYNETLIPIFSKIPRAASKK